MALVGGVVDGCPAHRLVPLVYIRARVQQHLGTEGNVAVLWQIEFFVEEVAQYCCELS